MSSNNLICTPAKAGLKNWGLSLLLQVNCKMTFVGRNFLVQQTEQTSAQNCTLTSIDFRQSISSWTKGSNISKACSSEEFTLDLFRLMCSSCHRKIRTYISKSARTQNSQARSHHCFRLQQNLCHIPPRYFNRLSTFYSSLRGPTGVTIYKVRLRLMAVLLKQYIQNTFLCILLTKFWMWSFFIWGDLTRSPESTRIYVLVLLLTRAFCPPLVGVGWSSKQLSGCSRGSGGGVAFFLKSSVCTAQENIQIWTLSTTILLLRVKKNWTVLSCFPHNKQKQVTDGPQCNKNNLKAAWQMGLRLENNATIPEITHNHLYNGLTFFFVDRSTSKIPSSKYPSCHCPLLFFTDTSFTSITDGCKHCSKKSVNSCQILGKASLHNSKCRTPKSSSEQWHHQRENLMVLLIFCPAAKQ